MKPIEILWFEDISPFHEPIFGFPLIGKLNMRQMLILGIGALFSWVFYQTYGSFLSFIPIVLTIFLTFKKRKVLSTEMYLFLVLFFYLSGKKKTNAQKIRHITKLRSFNSKRTSSNLRLAEPYDPKMTVMKKEINIREIHADPLKPIRLKVKLEKIEGKLMSNKQTQIVYGGNVVSILATDNNGEVEMIIIPQILGKKKIQIFVEGVVPPVFEEILCIKPI